METKKGTLEPDLAEPHSAPHLVEGEPVQKFALPLVLATTHPYAERDESTAKVKIDPLKGRTHIRDTYEIISLIGRGGTSSV